ncbi:ATP-binding protein, partial [Streptomyces sp. SID625]|nr:ATP-binding protein [Streptomyces sp. SID625]
VALLVGRRSADDPTADDPLRGLYLSQDAVRHLLHPAPPAPEPADASADASAAVLTDGGRDSPYRQDSPGVLGGWDGPGDRDDRLARLAARLGLGELDTALLLVALAPDLDRSFEPLYGYLNDDVSRRRATVALALDLCGVPVHSASARARLHSGAPLPALGLLTVEEPERPFLSRSLRVPDRLVAHLLGDDTPDAALAGHLRALPPAAPDTTDGDDRDGKAEEGGEGGGGTEFTGFARRLAARLSAGAPPTVYLREGREGEALTCVATALRTAGLAALHFAGPEDLVPTLLREARLSGSAVVISALPEHPAHLVRELTSAADVPVLITGAQPYDPHWSEHGAADPLVLDVPGHRAGAVRAWAAALGEEPGFDLAATVAPYHLADDRIARAAR